MSEFLRKICLHHQVLYETKFFWFHRDSDDVNIFYEKLSVF